MSITLPAARALYLQVPLQTHAAQGIERKYRELGAIIASQRRPGDQEWQRLSQTFPGILREAEMCAPETIAQRAEQAKRAGSWVGKKRGVLLQDPMRQAILWWDDAHQLLRDLIAWRRFIGSKNEGSDAFLRWTKSRDAWGFWPESSDLLVLNASRRLDQHSAYHWLAALNGMERPGLMRVLLDRRGARLQR